MLLHIHAALAALSVLPACTLAAKPVNQHAAQEVVAQLHLEPNVEKGYYAQTFEDPDRVNNRSVSTLIYYLLEGSSGQSVWHKVDAAEVWHYYAGAPLVLSLSNDDGKPDEKHVLGQDIFNGQAPQVVIAKNMWQSARSLGEWTLVGTTGTLLFVAISNHSSFFL